MQYIGHGLDTMYEYIYRAFSHYRHVSDGHNFYSGETTVATVHEVFGVEHDERLCVHRFWVYCRHIHDLVFSEQNIDTRCCFGDVFFPLCVTGGL
jgi:hypothetical protein